MVDEVSKDPIVDRGDACHGCDVGDERISAAEVFSSLYRHRWVIAIVLCVILCFVSFVCERVPSPPSLERFLSEIHLKESYEAMGGDNYGKNIASYGPLWGVNISAYPKNLVPSLTLPVRAYYDGRSAMLLCVPEVFPSDDGKAFMEKQLGIDDYSASRPTLYTAFLIFGEGAFPIPKSGVYTYLGRAKGGVRKAKLIVSRSLKAEIVFLVCDGAREWEIASVNFRLKRGEPFDGILNLPIQYNSQFSLARSFHEIDWENE